MGLSQAAYAIPIPDGGLFEVGCQVACWDSDAGATISYDAQTFAFSSDSRGLWVPYDASEGFDYAKTIQDASFSMQASIDNSGHLLGGIATWTGGSDGLGLAPDSLLMTANLIQASFVESFLYYDFVFKVTFAEQDLGLGDYVGYRVLNVPYDAEAPWANSYSGLAPYDSDELHTRIPVEVAAPSTLALLAAALLAGWWSAIRPGRSRVHPP